MNPMTLGDTPEEYIENEDGSVDIPDLEPIPEATQHLDNLAEVIPKSKLSKIASELVELIEKDKESRKKRDKQYEEGLRRTGLGDDAPGGAEFEGSSRVVHPVLAEGCVDFASRAIKELFPSGGPVKSQIIGETTPQKMERSSRKVRFMNWQLTTQISEYRANLEQLLTQLPMGGSQYQKFWYDERLARPGTEFVPVDEIYLPYAATDFYTASRVTHNQAITRFEFQRRVDSGLYRDVFLPSPGSTPEQSSAAIANDKIEGREDDGYNEDGLRSILEIYTWLEMDDDEMTQGEYAPYIITIDEDTEEVLSLYRNWKEEDPRFKKLDWMVEWKFLPWRGAYAIGLPHLIGGLSAALTGSLRALLDSAHINNAATMLKLKGGRIVGQNTQVNVTQVCDIEGPAGIDDVRKVAMPMPFNPPSPVLASLLDSLYGLAKGVISSTEDQVSQVGDRTPVGTTMALIETGSSIYSSIHSRLHESQKKALEILCRINSQFLNEEEVTQELGEQLITREDFLGSQDIIPVSDPNIFSEAQRFAQVQSLVQMSQDPSVPWNKLNIYRRVLKQMRIEAIDEILPPVKDPITDNLMVENAQFMKGFPLKAREDQDHMAHIQGHLTFLSSPLQSQNPLVSAQQLMPMLGHLEEHLQMLQSSEMVRMVHLTMAQMPGISPEGLMAQVTQVVEDNLATQLQPLMQQIATLQQQLQQKMPPPQMPPEVQASIQIAQMEVNRKTQLDQQQMQLEQQKLQLKQQQDALALQLKQQGAQQAQQLQFQDQQHSQAMEAASLQLKQQSQGTQHQIEMLKNDRDNQQKQVTELLKNRDDNETKLLIEQIKANVAKDQALQPHMEQLNEILDKIGGPMIERAITGTIDSLSSDNSSAEE